MIPVSAGTSCSGAVTNVAIVVPPARRDRVERRLLLGQHADRHDVHVDLELVVQLRGRRGRIAVAALGAVGHQDHRVAAAAAAAPSVVRIGTR